MTSEVRAKIGAADWRRATGISAGGEEPRGGGGGAAVAVYGQLDSGQGTRSTTKKYTSDSVNYNRIWTITLSEE